ncbi:VirB2 family type IV secretion system major pilin TrwL [Bartonella sp. A05]|uniref:VirB2 family type IV secretion system major pilin TrwL n=1 Tax=Bartonella sp. A05 TaxID=2967261 RepID=UPI0022A9CAF0|nr:VirB2 family type IV secretion system major pilin TrwL [Bartonella sp. A05]MCZ2203608.1 VirB2 family type IV secretion system major pilin TrwL [Bartonella sp. A05]
MKLLDTVQTKVNNKIISVFATACVFFVVQPAYAQVAGLANVSGVLTKFKGELDKIIPIAAALILLGLAIGYAGRYIEKDTFIRWAIGVIVAGSALQLANMLFKSN